MRSSTELLSVQFSASSRESDMVILGDCDKTVLSLADRIGWTSELEAIRVTSLEDSLNQ